MAIFRMGMLRGLGAEKLLVLLSRALLFRMGVYSEALGNTLQELLEDVKTVDMLLGDLCSLYALISKSFVSDTSRS
eukprot:4063597-Amphidinium_carterae.1